MGKKKKKEIKKITKFSQIIWGISIVLLVILGYFIYEANVLPAKYFFAITIMFVIFLSIHGILVLKKKTRTWVLVILNVLAILFMCGETFAIFKINDMITFLKENLNAHYETNVYNIIVNKESNYETLEDIKNKTIKTVKDMEDISLFEKSVKEKLNGLNNYSYSQISTLTGYSKVQLIYFSKELNKKDIDSMLVHGLTNKPSNNSPSSKEIEFIKNFKNKYPIISISQFQDIYHEDIIWNSKMSKIVKDNNLKVRSYSFFETLYEKEHWIKPIKHKCFNKKYESHPLREPSPQRGILIMIDGTPHDWFQSGRKSSLHLAIDDATGEALCGWFMPTECLEGYVRMLRILVTKYGIPQNIRY